MDITKEEYDAFVAKAAKVDVLIAENASLKVEADKVPALVKDVETAETAQKAAEKLAADEKAAHDLLKETARTANLSAERLNKLGAPFVAALGEKTKARLTDQAGTLEDAEWTSRLEELAELTKLDPAAGATAPAAGATTGVETASTQFGATGVPVATGTPGRHQVSSVLGGLLKQNRRPAPKSAPQA